MADAPLDLALDLNDVLRLSRVLLLECASGSGVLSATPEKHSFALQALVFCLGRTAESQRMNNGLVLSRDGRGLGLTSDAPLLVQDVLVRLLGEVLRREWHAFVLSRACDSVIACHALGVNLAAIAKDVDRAARNEGDAVSVATKLELARVADNLKGAPPPRERSVMTESVRGVWGEAMANVAGVACQLGLQQDAVVALLESHFAPLAARLSGDEERVLLVRLFEELVWNYGQQDAVPVARQCLTAVTMFVSRFGEANLVLQVAAAWVADKVEAAGWPFIFALAEKVVGCDVAKPLLTFLVAWSAYSTGRHAVPKLTMLMKVLPAIRKTSGAQFASVMNTVSAEVRKRTLGVEHLVLATALIAELPVRLFAVGLSCSDIELQNGAEDFSALFNKLVKRFAPYSSLVYLRMIEGNSQVKKSLIMAGVRSDVFLFYALQNSVLRNEKLAGSVAHLLSCRLPQAQFSQLCQLLLMLQDAGEDDAYGFGRELQEMLDKGTFGEGGKQLHDNVSRLLLYRAIYFDKLEKLRGQGLTTSQEVVEFDSAFPPHIVADAKCMRALSVLSRRIRTVKATRGGKFEHVSRLAASAVQHMLEAPGCKTLSESKRAMEEHIANLPANVACREQLLAAGFSPALFSDRVTAAVPTGTANVSVEDALRRDLLAVLAKYVPLLQSAKIEIVGGTPVAKLFDTFASFDQLQGERAQVVAALGGTGGAAVSDLLERESMLWRENERSVTAGSSSRLLQMRLNNSFLDAVAACDRNIAGCYAPDQVHAEKPMECGLKVGNRLWSLLDDGEEIESVESVWTSEGMLFFRSYGAQQQQLQQHQHQQQQGGGGGGAASVDTSLCYAALFKRLLLTKMVPRILLPRGYPNERCFRFLNNMVPSIYSRIDLTYHDQLFEDCPSYYDGENIEALRPGDLFISADDVRDLVIPGEVEQDMVLTSSAEWTLPRAAAPLPSAPAKCRELGQEVLRNTMRRVKETALGRHVAEYVAQYVGGTKDPDLLRRGFDWQRYLG